MVGAARGRPGEAAGFLGGALGLRTGCRRRLCLGARGLVFGCFFGAVANVQGAAVSGADRVHAEGGVIRPAGSDQSPGVGLAAGRDGRLGLMAGSQKFPKEQKRGKMASTLPKARAASFTASKPPPGPPRYREWQEWQSLGVPIEWFPKAKAPIGRNGCYSPPHRGLRERRRG